MNICNCMYKIKKQNGFSLIEVLAAVFVLAIGMLAVVGLQTKTIITSFENRDSIIASGLAQEGVELVRNIRDNNILNNREAFSGIEGKSSCKISADVTNCDLSGNLNLHINSNNIYGATGSVVSSYTRRVNVNVISGSQPEADELRVTSIVVWKNASFPSSCSECTVSRKCSCSEAILSKWQ